MSETVKKKPDFSSLDLSKITATEEGIPTGDKIPAPVEGLELSKKSIEGTWILGKKIEDVSPEEFKGWIEGLQIPDADKLDLSTMSTKDQRERLVLKVMDLLNTFNLRTAKMPKKYVN